MPSVSGKQHRLMAMVANDPAAAKRMGIPQSVGQEFMKADKGRKFGSGSRADVQSINKPKTEHGKSAILAKGGDVKESKAMVKKEIGFMKKAGAPKSMIKHEKAEMKGMKKGGIATSLKAHASAPASKAHAGMKKGGLAAGHKAADGVATKGKTKAMQVAMKRGGMCK